MQSDSHPTMLSVDYNNLAECKLLHILNLPSFTVIKEGDTGALPKPKMRDNFLETLGITSGLEALSLLC